MAEPPGKAPAVGFRREARGCRMASCSQNPSTCPEVHPLGDGAEDSATGVPLGFLLAQTLSFDIHSGIFVLNPWAFFGGCAFFPPAHPKGRGRSCFIDMPPEKRSQILPTCTKNTVSI